MWRQLAATESLRFDQQHTLASGTEPNDCPVAADVAARSLCLPTDPRLSGSQRKKIIDVFLEALQQAVEQPAC
jgi:dTDP-4-amino-4,6-dideoxygalactose transaminase